MRFALVSLIALLCSACSVAEAQPTEAKAKVDVGRYAYHPASGEMPAVILDTATGCLEIIEIWDLDAPAKGKLYMRRYADQTLGQWDQSDGEPKEIDGTRPPQRCPAKQER